MKRLTALILLLTFVLPGCKAQSQIEKAQAKVVSIGAQFLDYELTADEAVEQLDSIIIPETEGNGGLYLSTDKNYLALIIVKAKNGGSSLEDIREKVDSIKNRNYED